MSQTRGTNTKPDSDNTGTTKHVEFAVPQTDGETEAESDGLSDSETSDSEDEREKSIGSKATGGTGGTSNLNSTSDSLFTTIDKATTGGKLRKVYKYPCDTCTSQGLDCGWQAGKKCCTICERKHRACKRGGMNVSIITKKFTQTKAPSASQKSKGKKPASTPLSSAPSSAGKGSPFQRERSQRQVKPAGDLSSYEYPISRRRTITSPSKDLSDVRDTVTKPTPKTSAGVSTNSAEKSSSASTAKQATVDNVGSSSGPRPTSGRVSGIIIPLPGKNGATPSSSTAAAGSSSSTAAASASSATKQTSSSASAPPKKAQEASSATKQTRSSASAPAKKPQEASTAEKRKRPVLNSLTEPSSSSPSHSDADHEQPAPKKRKQDTNGASSSSAPSKKAASASTTSTSKNTTSSRTPAKARADAKPQPDPTKRPPKRVQPQRGVESLSPPPPPLPPSRNKPKRTAPSASSPQEASKVNAMFESYKNLDRLVDSLNDLMSVGDMTRGQMEEVQGMTRNLRDMKEEMRGWS